MRSLAIIPARGGSKRIPKKNIKSFGDVPVISFAIRAAMEHGGFDEVMVSTDSDEVAGVALNLGATIPFMRSAQTADDHATTAAVLTEVVQRYSELGQQFDIACCMYPCNPFLTAEKLTRGRHKLLDGAFDCVFSAVRYSYPPQRSFRMEGERMRLLHPEFIDTRSQDIPPVFHDAAQFYWFKISSLVQQGRLWTDNTGIVEIPESEVQDIDTLQDWSLAELKYRLWKQEEP